MTYLSPAAQAVMDAFESSKFADAYALAAALRAATDQVIRLQVYNTPEEIAIRDYLLSIATELENAND
jgi:hypothetical protein